MLIVVDGVDGNGEWTGAGGEGAGEGAAARVQGCSQGRWCRRCKAGAGRCGAGRCRRPTTRGSVQGVGERLGAGSGSAAFDALDDGLRWTGLRGLMMVDGVAGGDIVVVDLVFWFVDCVVRRS